MRGFAEWLQGSPLSVAIQSATWVIPTVQSIHILMIGIVFVSILMMAFRVLGWVGVDQSLKDVHDRYAPWMWGGFAVMALTGVVLVVGEPVREFMSTSFRVKMALVAVGAAGALAFARMIAATPAPAGAPSSAAAKSVALAAVALWLAIIFLGRAIAYDVEVWGPLSLAGGA